MSARPARDPVRDSVCAVGPTAVLLLSCPDQPGVVATVADFVWRNGGNIVHAEQHTDTTDGVFFQRVEFELEGFAFDRSELAQVFDPVARRFGMDVTIRFSDDRPRDGGARFDGAALPGRPAQPGARRGAGRGPVARGVEPRRTTPSSAGSSACRSTTCPSGTTPPPRTSRCSSCSPNEHIELVVLARYMRILSPGVRRSRGPNRIINIHHSFLPAFVGAQPYRQAHERGVKIIGATAHFVTAELDQGPDHRPGRGAHHPPRRRRGADPEGPRPGGRRARPGAPGAPGPPGAAVGQPHRRVRLTGSGAPRQTAAMPEGHTIHRLARDLNRTLGGDPVRAWSPQGRFSDGAASARRRAAGPGRRVGQVPVLRLRRRRGRCTSTWASSASSAASRPRRPTRSG